MTSVFDLVTSLSQQFAGNQLDVAFQRVAMTVVMRHHAVALPEGFKFVAVGHAV